MIIGMEWWITLIVLYVFSLSRYVHSQHNNNVFNDLQIRPQISIKPVKISPNDFYILQPPSSLSSSSSIKNTRQFQEFCLALRIPPHQHSFISSQLDLIKIYLQSNKPSTTTTTVDNDELFAILQLNTLRTTTTTATATNQPFALVTLNYVNQSDALLNRNINRRYPLLKSTNTVYLFVFTLVNPAHQQIVGKLASSTHPSCFSTDRLDLRHILAKFCISLIDCNQLSMVNNSEEEEETSDTDHDDGDADYDDDYPERPRYHRRVKRDVSSNTITTTTTTDDSSKPGLSIGLLVVVIIIPILAVIGLAIGGYFLYRWLHKRRASHGIYQPNYMENEANLTKKPEPHEIVKIPPEERLI